MKLTPLLNTLVQRYEAKGDLGPGSQHEPLQEAQDTMTFVGMGMTLKLFTEMDNQQGVDLDPTPGSVHFTAESLNGAEARPASGDGMKGSFFVDEEAGKAEMEFESFGSERTAVSYKMSNDSATLVAIEDLGTQFEATALQISAQNEQGKRVRLSGHWNEVSG